MTDVSLDPIRYEERRDAATGKVDDSESDEEFASGDESDDFYDADDNGEIPPSPLAMDDSPPPSPTPGDPPMLGTYTSIAAQRMSHFD